MVGQEILDESDTITDMQELAKDRYRERLRKDKQSHTPHHSQARVSENMEGMDREALKDLLSSIIDRITLDPVSHESEVSYRFAADLRNTKMASPRGCDLIPQFFVKSKVIGF